MNTFNKFIQTVKFNTNYGHIKTNLNNLGRWKITYNKLEINKKVDLANEDHCGVCYSTKYHNHQYIDSNNKKKSNSNIYTDEYLTVYLL